MRRGRSARPVLSPAPVPATCRRRYPRWTPGWSDVPHSRFSVICPVTVAPEEPVPVNVTFARPKSRIFGVPSLSDENVRGLDVAMNDAFGVGGIQSVGNLDRQTEQNIAISMGFPAMRCFSVMPSRNSIAMKAGRLARRCRKWCRCWDGSAPKRLGLRGGSVQSCGSWRIFRQEFQGDDAIELACLRPCRRRPCHRRRVFRGCGSARWFGQRASRGRAFAAHIRLGAGGKSTKSDCHCRFKCSAFAARKMEISGCLAAELGFFDLGFVAQLSLRLTMPQRGGFLAPLAPPPTCNQSRKA